MVLAKTIAMPEPDFQTLSRFSSRQLQGGIYKGQNCTSGTDMLLLYTCTWSALLEMPQQCHSESGSSGKLSLHTSCDTYIQSSSCVTHALSMTADHRKWYVCNSTMQTKRTLLESTPELVLPSL